ncbi:MAG: TetR/AcrR family transcriptional regulator [Alphaproteobacteria bacterium]|nr:TetR/AcrR family transcriptional regulator [Alphaproteobacteria bacterium]
MSGLRESQKAGRRKRILDAARAHFLDRGFEATTIEAIAESAEISAVTVFNYYGTKGGVLLALVGESDSILIEKINGILGDPPLDPLEAVLRFSQVICRHALDYLHKPVWRHVVATAVIEGNSEFGRGYASLDLELVRMLASLLEILKDRNRLQQDYPCAVAAGVLYNLHNARFIKLMSDDKMSIETFDELVRADIAYAMTQTISS